MPAWSRIRSRYAALRNYTYLDTAGTGIMSVSTAKAARRFYDEVSAHGNTRLETWLERVEKAREQVAALTGAGPGEVAFVPNTSHGMNIAALMLKGAGRVVTDEAEFPSSTVPWLHHGYRVDFVKARDNAVYLDDIEKVVSRNKKGVLVHSYVQYASGFRQDMAALGRLARKYGHYFVANITQGCGAFPVELGKWGVDVACCTGVKWLCAGEGAGFIYVRRGLLGKFRSPLAGWLSVKDPMGLENRTVDLKDEAARFELGGLNMPNIFALGSAVKEARRLGVDNIARRIHGLTDYMRDRLEAAGVAVVSPGGRAHGSGIVLVKVPDAAGIVDALKVRKVRVSARGGGIRVSAHFYNNRDDIDGFIHHLGRLL